MGEGALGAAHPRSGGDPGCPGYIACQRAGIELMLSQLHPLGERVRRVFGQNGDLYLLQDCP